MQMLTPPFHMIRRFLPAAGLALALSACGTAPLEGQTTPAPAEAATPAPMSRASEAAAPLPEWDVPDAVARAFIAKYPGEKSPDWGRDRNDSYEAKFRKDGIELRADFTPGGQWIETERSLSWDELPQAVRDAVEREYDKDDIVELEYTENAERGNFYDVEIDEKGEKKKDVEYRADGRKV